MCSNIAIKYIKFGKGTFWYVNIVNTLPREFFQRSTKLNRLDIIVVISWICHLKKDLMSLLAVFVNSYKLVWINCIIGYIDRTKISIRRKHKTTTRIIEFVNSYNFSKNRLIHLFILIKIFILWNYSVN